MKAASLILPILLATSCAGTGDRPAADFSPTAIPGAEQHMTGAYTAQREPSEEEVSLLGQVAGDENLLLTPLSVATQVVAGLNTSSGAATKTAPTGHTATAGLSSTKTCKATPLLQASKKNNSQIKSRISGKQSIIWVGCALESCSRE